MEVSEFPPRKYCNAKIPWHYVYFQYFWSENVPEGSQLQNSTYFRSCWLFSPSLTTLERSKLLSGVAKFVYFEIAAIGGCYGVFVLCRRNEPVRRFLHDNFPRTLELYYKSEDLISGGRHFGQQRKHLDRKLWSGEEKEPEVV
uniref:Uncharacterized protein n=1 Tax=Bursaphelenchus xylophilus TaxID=6326 RepID=A0A1I7S135_BURXY